MPRITPYFTKQTLTRLTLLLIVAVGLALRLYALGRESLWYDELLQLDIAQGPFTTILPQLFKHSAVPLDYYITHFWVSLGRSDTWVRLPAVFIGTLTLPLAYQLGRRWLDEPTALLFMGLMALSPFHIRYSQEARPYALLVFGVMLAGYAFWQFRQSGRLRYLVQLQIGVLIFSLAHFFAVVIFIPWLLFAGIDVIFSSARRQRIATTLGSLFLTGTVTLVIILALGWGRTLWNVTWWGFGTALVETERFSLEAAEKPNFGTGPQLTTAFIKNDLLGPLGGGYSDTALRLFNSLVGLGVAYLLVMKRYKLTFFLLSWLILPAVIIIVFLMQRGAFFEERYIISVLPAYLTLLAVGILSLPRWLKCAEPRGISTGTLLLLTGAVFAVFGMTLQNFYTEQSKEDWRLVAQLLTQNAAPQDAIIAVNAESTLNWYYPPASTPPDHFDKLDRVASSVAEAERGWVIMSIFTNYIGEGQRVERWLAEQGAVRLAVDPLIAVYYVSLKASPPQLLEEVRDFALPINHRLYAELARQNQREPAIARQYYQVALDHAPDDETRAQYQAALEALTD